MEKYGVIDASKSIARGNETGGTLDGKIIYNKAGVCTAYARISGLTGINRVNYIPFSIPSGLRPPFSEIVPLIFILSDGTVKFSYAELQAGGNVVSSYALTPSDAELVESVILYFATWYISI